jgi:hypothetical protein
MTWGHIFLIELHILIAYIVGYKIGKNERTGNNN